MGAVDVGRGKRAGPVDWSGRPQDRRKRPRPPPDSLTLTGITALADNLPPRRAFSSVHSATIRLTYRLTV